MGSFGEPLMTTHNAHVMVESLEGGTWKIDLYVIT